MADNEPMTDEQFAEMQAALAAEQARRAAAHAADRAARLAPVVAITSGDAFAVIHTAIDALSTDLLADGQIGPCIKAMRVGMDGLMKFAPAAAE